MVSVLSKNLLLSEAKNPLLSLEKNESKNESSADGWLLGAFWLLDDSVRFDVYPALMLGALLTKDKIERNVAAALPEFAPSPPTTELKSSSEISNKSKSSFIAAQNSS